MELLLEDIGELYEGIEKAIRQLGDKDGVKILDELSKESLPWLKAHREMEHTIPSPSSIMDCRRALYWRFKNRPMDYGRKPPLYWVQRSSIGILTETYWMAILKLAGLNIELPNVALPCGDDMIAHPDGIGDTFITEYKNTTGWGYRKFVIDWATVVDEYYNHYAQVQLGMYAAGKEKALYVASTPDPGFLQSLIRQRKGMSDFDIPVVYLEIINRNDNEIEMLLERAKTIKKDQEGKREPEAEFDGREYTKKGTKTYPCGYCVHIDSCNAIGGLTWT